MKKLTDIWVDEVSLVDEGANPEADVLLFKRDKSAGATSDAVTAACQEVIAKLQRRLDDLETAELQKQAARYEILGCDSSQLAKLLQKSKAENPALHAELVKTLDAALAATEKSGVFTELGKTGTTNQSGDIQTFAAQIRKQNPKLTFRQALDEAYLQHPELQN